MSAPDPGITDEAVETGYEAVNATARGVTAYRHEVRLILAAVVPLLRKAWEQELRQQICAEMLAVNTRYVGTTEAALGYLDGLRCADAIARGDQ